METPMCGDSSGSIRITDVHGDRLCNTKTITNPSETYLVAQVQGSVRDEGRKPAFSRGRVLDSPIYCFRVGPFFLNQMLTESESRIIEYSTNEWHDSSAILVQTTYNSLSRSDVMSLCPRSVLSLKIVSVVAEQLSANDRSLCSNSLKYMFLPCFYSRRAKLNAATTTIPMANRAKKALEAIYLCCFEKEPIEEEDERLLITILRAVFPSVEQPEIERIVKDKALKVAEGSDESNVPESKSISKEAVKQQMKDLEFLKQNSEA